MTVRSGESVNGAEIKAVGADYKSMIAIAVLAVIHFVIHAVTNGNYGIFRDEFYYIACSDHLAWGYVDHPPLSIALLSLSRTALGDSVHAIRFLSGLSGAVLVFLAGVIARELGGRSFAQILAAVCTMISPLVLVTTGFFSMNAFDLLFWTVTFYLVIRLVKTDDTRLWLPIGIALGFGLLNKISVLFLGIAIVIGMLCTPQRKYFRSRYLWIGGAVAVLMFLPHIVWQIRNGWPTLEFIRNAKLYKIAALNPLEFFLEQVKQNHPFNFPIWIIGLGFLLFSKRVRSARLIGLIYIIVFVLFVIQRSKAYYLGPAYPVLFAAGATAIEHFFMNRRVNWAKIAVIVVVIAGGLVTAPLFLPILAPEQLVSYQTRIGMEPSAGERHELGALPQYFADRFGWENMAATVSSVYRDLPLAQRERCLILTSNYGEAGAIDYYRRTYDLPPAVSGHNNYFLWGPGDFTGDTIITIDISQTFLERFFNEVTAAATIHSPYAMPSETGLTVYLCRGLKVPLEEAWQAVKHYI